MTNKHAELMRLSDAYAEASFEQGLNKSVDTPFPEQCRSVLDTALQDALQSSESQTPQPPIECQTDAEKKAFAFGWWKAIENVRREQPASAAVPFAYFHYDTTKNPEYQQVMPGAAGQPGIVAAYAQPPVSAKPLTLDQLSEIVPGTVSCKWSDFVSIARSIESAHNITQEPKK